MSVVEIHMAIDPKVWNLFRFFIVRMIAVIAFFFVFIKVTGFKNTYEVVGAVSILLLIRRIAISVYRRLIIPAKDPLEYGKWAIVTGSTSGIGKEFADHLASRGLNILLTSRSVEKLTEQKKELEQKYNVEVEFLAFDYTKSGEERKQFYKALDAKCAEINAKGGLGMLVNNVGISNEIPMNLDEFSVRMLILYRRIHVSLFVG